MAPGQDKDELSAEEIEAQHADDLPDREAMSLIAGLMPPTIAPLEPVAPGVDQPMPPVDHTLPVDHIEHTTPVD